MKGTSTDATPWSLILNTAFSLWNILPIPWQQSHRGCSSRKPRSSIPAVTHVEYWARAHRETYGIERWSRPRKGNVPCGQDGEVIVTLTLVGAAAVFAIAFLLVLLGEPPAAAQQRLRATENVNFYAAPNGNDLNNNCLSAAIPCTPNGAYAVAKNDWDFAGNGCYIRLADGVYTQGIFAYGQLVGVHACTVMGHVDQAGNCLDSKAVIFDAPPGKAAFSIQDGMIAGIICVWARGSVGFHGRQMVVVDLVDVACGPIIICIQGTMAGTQINIAGKLQLRGNITSMVAMDKNSVAFFARTQLAVDSISPITIDYLIQADDGAHIEFIGNPPIENIGYILGADGTPGSAKCIVAWMGRVKANGLNIPCEIISFTDGKFYR
jgi:hypothetical protein